MGGILLGPSVMGRIPGFTTSIFPDESMPNLNLVANVGLVLFLFLVGLEADLRLVVSNWRIAFSVGAAGMIVPFGLGCGIAYGLFHQFNSEPGIVPIGFGVYMLFVGVAMAITVGLLPRAGCSFLAPPADLSLPLYPRRRPSPCSVAS